MQNHAGSGAGFGGGEEPSSRPARRGRQTPALLPLPRSSSLLGDYAWGDDDGTGADVGGAAGSGGGTAGGLPTLTEVPLLYHDAGSSIGGGAGGGRGRFVLDDVGASIAAAAVDHGTGGGSGSDDSSPADPAWLRGCASATVHTLRLRRAGAGDGGIGNVHANVMVTTAACPEDPTTLLLSLLPMAAAPAAAASGGGGGGSVGACTVELDMGSLSNFGRPVKVASFVHRRFPRRSDAGDGNPGGSRSAAMTGSSGYATAAADARDTRANDGGPVLRLNLVDTAGTVLSVLFSLSADANTNSSSPPIRPTPISMTVHSIPALIEDSAPNLYIAPGSILTATDVDFLSATRLVVALPPHLLSVDLLRDRNNVVPWTMAAGRRSTIGGILSRAGNLLIGREIDEDDYADNADAATGAGVSDGGGGMGATSALCVVTYRDDNPDHLDQEADHHDDLDQAAADDDDATRTTVVFSLHADGTVRMWSVGRTSTRSSLQPRKVRLIQVPGEMRQLSYDDKYDRRQESEDPPLPPPATWSSDPDAVSLAGRLYRSGRGDGADLKYALAVAVRTADDPMAGYGGILGSPGPRSPSQQQQQEGASPCHVLVLSGRADAKPGLAGTDGAVPLIVPRGSTSVVGMQFAPTSMNGIGGGSSGSSSKCELHALYATKEGTGAGRGMPGSVLAFYPPSPVDTVCHAPRRLGMVSTVDQTARVERDAILSLGTAATTETNISGEADNDDKLQMIEEALTAVDAAFLSALFRPTHARSAGGSAPSPAAVRRAIARLVPSYRIAGEGEGTGTDTVEVDALLAVREWRRVEEARAEMTGAAGRARKRKMMMTSDIGNDDDDGGAAPSTATTGQLDQPSNVYQAFATPGRRRDRHSWDDQGGDRMDVDVYGTTAAPEEDEDDADASKESQDKKIASHRSRWTTFLLAVFDEESIARAPLCLASISATSQAPLAAASESTAIVRGTVTSCVVTSHPRPFGAEEEGGLDDINRVMERLDGLSISVLRYLQCNGDDEHRARLINTEAHLSGVIAKAGLIMEKMDQATLDQLSYLGSWAMSEISARNMEGTATTAATITSLLEVMTPEAINFWLTSSFHTSATVRPFLPMIDDSQGIYQVVTASSVVDANRLASCSAYLARLHIDAVREITLSRCLLLCGAERLMNAPADDFPTASVSDEANLDSALRAHLYAIAVQWVIAQKLLPPFKDRNVRVPSSGPDAVDASPASFPPGARSRIATAGNSTSSVSSTSNLTALEAHLLHDAKACISSGQSCIKAASRLLMSPSAIGIAHAFVHSAFGEDTAEAKIAMQPKLAELGLLSHGIADQPRLALRLLAPSISYPPPLCDMDTNRTRVETAAECLLMEATFAQENGTMASSRVFALRERASALLRDSYARIDNEASSWDSNAVFEVLRGANQQASTTETHVDVLEEAMQQILYPLLPPRQIGQDIKLLCKMQTVKFLFLPWVVSAKEQGADMLTLLSQSFPESVPNPRTDLKCTIQVLLRTSNLMHRITILERHCSAGTGSGLGLDDTGTNIVLSAIQDAIATLTDYLPRIMFEDMGEYATLWSSAFRHAQQGQKWAEAYSACLANPIKERRLNNFRRLVVCMADAGAFQEFLCMILSVVDKESKASSRQDNEGGDDAMDVEVEPNADPLFEINEGVTDELDLYEIAAETLADAAIQQSRREGVSRGSPNYNGCLYALHASRGNWRRAAQAMDFYDVRVISATGAFAFVEGEESNSTNSPLLNAQVVADVSLSALSSAHCIQLEEKPTHRFIVKGELGPYPLPPFFRNTFSSQDAGAKKALKNEGRRNGLLFPLLAKDSQNCKVMDRMSRLMTEKDMIARSIHTIALRTLYMDEASPPDSLLAMIQKSLREVIDSLIALGYYDLAAAIAKSLRDEKEGSRPKGRDIFYDALAYSICKYLAPSAVRSGRPLPSNVDSEDNQWERNGPANELLSRPTVHQVQSSLDSFPNESQPRATALHESWKSRELQVDIAQSAMRMELLRRYTVCYSNGSNTLALEVAEMLVDLDCGRSELPLWLIDLLLGRKLGFPDSSRNGLFANSAQNNGTDPSSACSAADPPGLLRLLMKKGLLAQACDVVSSVMTENANRQQQATSRLPEKGDIDYVPYNTIDMLWSIIDATVKTGDLKTSERDDLLRARAKMERALEQHFECMKLSEEGLRSARALDK